MIERMLTRISVHSEQGEEVRRRIRRELRVLKFLGLSVLILFGVVFISTSISCTPAPKPAPNPIDHKVQGIDPLLLEIPDLNAPPTIRVLLREADKAETLSIRFLTPSEFTTDGGVVAGHSGIQITVSKRESGMHARVMDGSEELLEFTFTRASLRPSSRTAASEASFSLSGFDFEGSLELRLEEGKFQALNDVDLEAYCRGSVGWEAIPSWHVEALKAQAVAIRTYTLFTIYHHRASAKRKPYDVDNTTRYLRYGGLGPSGKPHERKASANVVRAVRDSAGEVMLYQGKIFKAFFSSSSGGHTASVATSFGLAAIPPLRGVKLGDYGKKSSLHRWVRAHETHSVATKLAKAGHDVGELRAINVESNDPSGFAQRVVVVGSKRSKTLGAYDFRRLIGTGPKGLPSTNFVADLKGDEIEFSGRGWGHGVGMDQWAAQGMAEAGISYRDILRRHYPETSVTRPWLK